MFNPVLIYIILNAFSKFSFQNYFVFLLTVHVTLAITTYLSYRFLEAPFLGLKEKFAVIKSGGFENVNTIPANEKEVFEPTRVNENEAIANNLVDENDAFIRIPLNVREE
jgi:hypothetical protein